MKRAKILDKNVEKWEEVQDKYRVTHHHVSKKKNWKFLYFHLDVHWT